MASLTIFNLSFIIVLMWQRRELTMRNLTDLSRWLRETPGLKEEWGADWWRVAFNACSSPSEWAEFQKTYGSDARAQRVIGEYQEIDDKNQDLPRSKVHESVKLPELDK